MTGMSYTKLLPSRQKSRTLRVLIFLGWQQWSPQEPSQRLCFTFFLERHPLLGSKYSCRYSIPWHVGAAKETLNLVLLRFCFGQLGPEFGVVALLFWSARTRNVLGSGHIALSAQYTLGSEFHGMVRKGFGWPRKQRKWEKSPTWVRMNPPGHSGFVCTCPDAGFPGTSEPVPKMLHLDIIEKLLFSALYVVSFCRRQCTKNMRDESRHTCAVCFWQAKR